MYRIIDKRGSGKTSRLLLLAKQSGSIIVCSNPTAMRAKAIAYGLTGIDFVSYRTFIEDSADFAIKATKNYLIDEIDEFLHVLSSGHIDGYTLTDED